MSMLKRLLSLIVLVGIGSAFAWPTCRPEIVCEFNPVSVDHIVAEAPDFTYDGSDWTGLSAWTDRTMPVKGGACLRADIAWRKRVWHPEGVRSMEVLTGQRVVSRTKDYLEIYLPYRESAVFKLRYE